MKPLLLVQLSCILGCILSSCVSVQFADNSRKQASSLQYEAPKSPFRPISSAGGDMAWQSSRTHGVIAFLSSCDSKTDPSLEALEYDSLSALSDLKRLKSDKVNFNARASIQTLASGRMDGVPVKVSVTIFKKNNCDYTLSFSSRAELFDSELEQFNKFKESFVVP